ncbi:MAG: hypothetical protein FJ109_04815 [Deltaproteobacteria bacterium]|nr:hypothetical protein [Deltaproteobacteria bacterium]
MKTISRLLLLALLLPACAPDSLTGGLYIIAGQAVSPKTQCMAKAGGGATEIRSIGTLDLVLSHEYLFFPIVKNEMDALDQSTGQISESGYLNTNAINIKGAWITYSIKGLQGPYDGNGKTSLGETYVPTSGTVEPDGGTTTIMLPVVPFWIGAELDRDKAFDTYLSGGYMTAAIKLEGELLDGTLVRSSTFHFPILLCRACLIGLIPDWAEGEDYNYCAPGQDIPIDTVLAQFFVSSWQPDRWQEKLALLQGQIRSLSETLPE